MDRVLSAVLIGLTVNLIVLAGCGEDSPGATADGDDTATDVVLGDGVGSDSMSNEDTTTLDDADEGTDDITDTESTDVGTDTGGDVQLQDVGIQDTSDASDATYDGPHTAPQLVSSEPVHGEFLAPRTPLLTLHFDRPIPLANLEGKVSSTREDIPTPTAMQAMACPDTPGDPACVQLAFDASFVEGEQLASGLYHTVILDSSLADAHGNTLGQEVTVRFATQGPFLVVDDSGSGNLEASGITFDQRTSSLFYTVRDITEDPEGPINVRRILNIGPGMHTPTAFATLQVGPSGAAYFSALSALEGHLYVIGPYTQSVWVFDDPGVADGAAPSRVITGTGLAAPNNTLWQVASIARTRDGRRHYFGFGYYVNLDRPTAVAQLDGDTWSLFGEGQFSTSDNFAVASREDVAPGVVYIAHPNGIVKLSEDGTVLNHDDEVYVGGDPQIWVDSTGRLYLMHSQSPFLEIFDTSGDSGFTRVRNHNNGNRNRFAVHERGNVLTIYTTQYRSPAVIYGERISFCEGDGACVASCENMVLDANETEVDCGGTCDPCEHGQACVRGTDCSNGYCNNGVCGEEEIGCADGTREGFIDLVDAPEIAGCSGAWSIPGLVGGESATPACDRAAGNDADNEDGDGCRAADLCAEGWRVCSSPAEVSYRAPGRTCADVTQEGDPPLFFATAVQSGGSGSCTVGQTDHANDIFGCGNLGAPTPDMLSCGPLDVFSGNACVSINGLELPFVWQCGSDEFREAMMVTKNDSNRGGVLCCKCGPEGCD
ncbi:MAG: hypothetical protein KC561_10055 [Myxococcales bacterium]|nr:hypothetical protein [Myxococcales bacterium]